MVSNRSALDCLGLEAAGVCKEFSYLKRKKKALCGMINFMKHIAKGLLCPVNLPSKWEDSKGQDFFSQVLRAREVLSQRCVEQNDEHASLQYVSKYEDEVAHGDHSTTRLRRSGRQSTSVKYHLRSYCKSHFANGNRLTSSVNSKAKKCPVKKAAKKAKSKVRIGPLRQAEVPEWTGVVFESDCKFLGTQVWPLEHDSKPTPKTEDLIEREIEHKCNCYVLGSVECNRFHIAEKRMQLKFELGPLFYCWGFDSMGEEVALKWTTEEERSFKELKRSYKLIIIENEDKKAKPLIVKKFLSFFDDASTYFRGKTRRNLVSYFFNVFVIQQRIYQNRETSYHVDSDDDEEFGSFGHGFGMEARGVRETLPKCSLYKQCTDFEYI